MKKLFNKIWTFLTNLRRKATIVYENLDINTQKLVHLSVHLVQALKTVTVDSKVDDVIVAIFTKLYPKFGPILTTFMLQLETWIPKWLTELEVAQNVLSIRDPNERLIAIIDALNISDTKSEEYLQFASKCLYYLDGGEDGKLGWEDCRAVVEEYYEGYVKK